MKNRKRPTERNWMLVIISLVLIVFGGTLLFLAVSYIHIFGWWSLAIGLGGACTISLSITAIATNNPAWILLDLIT